MIYFCYLGKVCDNLCCLMRYIFFIVATIGFINTSYTVNEYDGIATMTVGVLPGSSIEIDIVLIISLLNGSAVGELK